MSDFISGKDIITEKGLQEFELVPMLAGLNAYDGLGRAIGNPILKLISSSILYHEGEIAGNDVRKQTANEEIRNRKLEIESIKKGTSSQLINFLQHRANTVSISKTEWKKRQIANHERQILNNEQYLNSNPDYVHREAINCLRRIEKSLAGGLSPIRWDDFWPLFQGPELTNLVDKLKACLFSRKNIDILASSEHHDPEEEYTGRKQIIDQFQKRLNV